MALKLRRAVEEVFIQYCTRAVSFKRLLGAIPSGAYRNTTGLQKDSRGIGVPSPNDKTSVHRVSTDKAYLEVIRQLWHRQHDSKHPRGPHGLRRIQVSLSVRKMDKCAGWFGYAVEGV